MLEFSSSGFAHPHHLGGLAPGSRGGAKGPGLKSVRIPNGKIHPAWKLRSWQETLRSHDFLENFWGQDLLDFTKPKLPKFGNSTPRKLADEKWWLEDDPFLLKWFLFRSYAKLRGCKVPKSSKTKKVDNLGYTTQIEGLRTQGNTES